MRSPAGILGGQLSGPKSRRGFLAALGKFALLAGAAFAGVGGTEVFASCGSKDCYYYGQDYGYGCPAGDSNVYVGCCKYLGVYYETRSCQHYDRNCNCTVTDCTFSFPTQPNCPQVPAR